MWEASSGDSDFFAELCECIVSDLPPIVRTLEDALNRRDLVAARSAAHGLKGTALQTKLPFAGSVVALGKLLRGAASRAETQEAKPEPAAAADAQWAEMRRAGRVVAAQVATAVEEALAYNLASSEEVSIRHRHHCG